MTDGRVPYRDFWLEYPPGALPAFALPALAQRENLSSYSAAFSGLMWLCAAMALLAMTVTLRYLSGSIVRTSAAVAFIALAPVVLGRLIIQRFDLWPAALLAVAVAAALSGRHRLGFLVLGVAVAAKAYPRADARIRD
jgi:hypothetical protein